MGVICFSKILAAVFRRLLYTISLPIALIIVSISPIVQIRLIGLQAFRIGHYALNTELMLCFFDINSSARRKKTLFYNMSKPCNTYLYKMWSRVIPIFPFSRLAIQIDQILSLIFGKPYSEDYVKITYESCATGAVDKYGFLKKIEKPHLFFTENEKKNAKNIMNQFCISDGAKFICLVVRDSAYLNHEYPENNWQYHDHRNADIMSYQKAALYLAEKGYYVLRMGKFVEKKFQSVHPRIIDYANHPLRSDFMDIYLMANCLFCISTCTGLDCVSQIFRKPVLLTNISPVFGETLMWYPCTLFIPKILKNKKSNQCLKFSETAEICSSLKSSNILEEFSKRDLMLVENNENQLLEIVMEMEMRVNGKFYDSKTLNDIQVQYWLCQKKYRPIYVDDIYIKIGSDFLYQNIGLLYGN